jgi:hypothetical protein
MPSAQRSRLQQWLERLEHVALGAVFLYLAVLAFASVAAGREWSRDNGALRSHLTPRFTLHDFRIDGVAPEVSAVGDRIRREVTIVSGGLCPSCGNSVDNWKQLVESIPWTNTDRITWISVDGAAVPPQVRDAARGRVPLLHSKVTDRTLFAASTGISNLPMTIASYEGRMRRIVNGSLSEETSRQIKTALSGQDDGASPFAQGALRTSLYGVWQASGRAEDCSAYSPASLRVERDAEGWSVTAAGTVTVARAATEADAQRMNAVAAQHSRVCYIGRDPETRMFALQYWDGPTPLPPSADEDCLAHDPAAIRVAARGLGEWRVSGGERLLAVFKTEEDAIAAWQRFSETRSRCFIGRGNEVPNRKAYILHYWR